MCSLVHAGNYGAVDPQSEVLQEYLLRLQEQAAQVRELIASQRGLEGLDKALRGSLARDQMIPAGVQMVPVHITAGAHAWMLRGACGSCTCIQ